MTGLSSDRPVSRGAPSASAHFPGYYRAFHELEPLIGRLLSLSRVQEVLLALIGDLEDTVTISGEAKEAVWFIAAEIRGAAGELDQRWTDLHNAGVDQGEKRSPQNLEGGVGRGAR